MHRNKSVDVHQFAMVPRADVPRSQFRMEKTLKTAFDSGFLIPVFCEEVLPGDSMRLSMTSFCRMTTPLVPVMDNMYLDSFFFFVPNRLVWTNWKKFMGEQDNPADSISFVIPVCTAPVSGWTIGSLGDYFGLPTVGQVTGGNTPTHSALPLRAFNLIYNQWFRDENLVNSATVNNGNGPDAAADYPLQRRGKRHDYFTGALPWVQKGATSVSIPLGSSATVKAQAGALLTGAQPAARMSLVTGGATTGGRALTTVGGVNSAMNESGVAAAAGANDVYFTNLYADLSTATAATINQLRQSFQIQRLLERDARGGTRYTEIVRAHFGVTSPDARLQRPEYLGGGSQPVSINPIAQTSATGLTGGATPVGKLAAFGTVLAHGHGFSQSFTEHGYIIGLVSVRADLTYQQGLRRHWSRNSRYDFYFPAFAMLGEQAVLNKEIYFKAVAADDLVFGYQERWAEYRYMPSEVTGLMRSTAAGTVDYWHLAQKFTALPTLNQTFIEENPPIDRVVAVASEPEFFGDFFFSVRAARPLPMYSVPGLIDHF